MTTTININGLDVEFTDQKPTKVGVYWWANDETDVPEVYEVRGFSMLDVLGGLWSTSPLVPATEVEKAYREGFYDGAAGMNITSTELIAAQSEDYDNSNARRVVEGE